jgi:hypothetical protein
MKPVTFFEVMGPKGDVEYGDASPYNTINWWRRGIGKTIFASVWDEETEDFKLITDRIDVTPLIQAAIISQNERT